MRGFFFSENMKLADLISENYNLILMLPRFGIPLGFGDKSVADICKNHHIPVDFFLLVCNIYSFEHFIPDKMLISSIDMNFLLPYLLASHRYYKEELIPHIENHLQHLIEKSEAKYGKILLQFFNEYKEEVNEHFRHEEEQVFPHLEALQKGNSDNSYRIRTFVPEHSNIEDKLSDLTRIICKYFPGNILPNESIELIFDILQLSDDLEKHKLIEEKILVPYVVFLERRFR
jgi:regulator of cell morphogenesis and NO signaling